MTGGSHAFWLSRTPSIHALALPVSHLRPRVKARMKESCMMSPGACCPVVCWYTVHLQACLL